MKNAPEVIDDLSLAAPLAANGNRWALVSDQVMGGVSDGAMRREIVAGRPAIRLRGGVSLENNGGFLQIALDLGDDGAPVDAASWTGIRIDVSGNNETYNLHLRTTDLDRPWQSYRQGFVATPTWQTLHFAFAGFEAHRTTQALQVNRLRRVGIVAIGRAFDADLALADIRFYSAGDGGDGDGGASHRRRR